MAPAKPGSGGERRRASCAAGGAGLMAHAASFYAAGADQGLTFPALEGGRRCDVLVVGGGYTGLSAALHLAERGVDVVLVEAERVGWGASGRNGGQLHSGQRQDQEWLEAKFGRAPALALWRMAEEAKALVLGLIARHGIACDWRPGLIEAVHKGRLVAGERAYAEHLREAYGYDAVEWLDREAFAAATGAQGYHGGRRDRGAGHLDPLKLAQGLARAAASAGAAIHEGTRVRRLAGSAATGFTAECGSGTVRADMVVLAGNAYLAGLDAEAESRLMPIVNYLLATEPLGAGRPGGLLPGGEAVSDTRFVVYYWRPTADGRLVFGGGETYRRHAGPADTAAFVRRHLLRIYPQLAGARIDYAWGGQLAITMRRLPLIRRTRPGVYVAAGYSGQGVALAPYAGKLIAEAIAGDSARFDRMAALPAPRFPGGRLLRWPSLVAGMTWYALRDRL